MSRPRIDLSAGRQVPNLIGVFDPTTPSYTFLRDELGVEFGQAVERLETVLATPRKALLIGTNPVLPMLGTHRVSYDSAGRPIERVRSLYQGDRFSFVTRLSPQP